MLTAALFLTPNCKQPKCPSRADNRWYSHTTKYYIIVTFHTTDDMDESLK